MFTWTALTTFIAHLKNFFLHIIFKYTVTSSFSRNGPYTVTQYTAETETNGVTEMVGHLGWEPLATRRRNMRLCMMYKIAHTVVGDPWTEWLTTSKRVTRGFHAWKYIPIYSHHNIYKFSFLPRTIIDWNSLSPHSVDSPSIDTFRARITRN